MRIKFILFNILLIIFLFILVYLFIYVNYNYEKFEDNNITQITHDLTDNSNKLEQATKININEISRVIDGSSPDNAFLSAEDIVFYNKSNRRNNIKRYNDNYYWINLPVIGPQYIYCITDEKFFGGGWMLALRSVKDSKEFNYNSKHWTTNSILNSNYNDIKLLQNNITENEYKISSIGNVIYKNNFTQDEISKYDAKFNTFNYYKAKEWMAIFYTKLNDIVIIGGDNVNNNRGWIWYEDNIVNLNNENRNTLLNLFQTLDYKKQEINLFNNNKYKGISKPSEIDKIKPYNKKSLWSAQSDFQFYGINYTYGDILNRGPSVRWGFAWNENGPNNRESNDVYNGIGLEYLKRDGGNSAGDFIYCCESQRGINSSLSFEWYIR